MIVDIYTHIFPERFFQELERGSPKLGNMGKRLRSVRKLFDLDLRFRDMDEIGDYRQIISLPNPPIEDIAEGAVANNLAKVANDSMAELCAKHPERFPAFAAAVSMHDVDFSIARGGARHQDGRARRADLHQHRRPSARRAALSAVLRGDGGARPADLAASGAHLGDGRTTPPSRARASRCGGASAGPTRPRSRCAGWCSTASTTAIPKLKIITHHLGGGMIPFFDGRIGAGMEVLGQRTVDEDHTKVLSSLKRPHLEYFKEFYADTAMFGGTYGLPCGIEFFGGRQGGVRVRRAARRHPDAHQGARRPQSRRRRRIKKIMHGNAEKLLNMRIS